MSMQEQTGRAVEAPEPRVKPTKKGLVVVKVLAPFFPVVIGGALKLALLDNVPTLDTERTAFLMNAYAKPLWLQLLVSAYILPIAAIMSGVVSKGRIAALYIVPAVVFFLCLILSFGLPKLTGSQSLLLQVWLPAVVSGACVVVLGVILVTAPRA
ncbi:MAG TPA: hypothetical protein VN882_05365 [Steroidobacteraceae bacterium]|jgi:hypothetical protein|nr:hypothetical protein [Steroidobacteraceae bacterium]